jgi:hypothetical protein
MMPGNINRRFPWLLAMACVFALTPALADVLVGANGERFVGKVVQETTNSVVFESETLGRITVARDRIRELQRTPATVPAGTNTTPDAVSLVASNAAWQPPGVGKDGFDWIQLKSDEWLKGYLDYVQNKKVQFESDKLENLTLDFKDVRRLYSAKPMFVKFEDREQIFGTVAISNDVVEVIGPEQVRLSRSQLTGIAPGGARELDFWSARVSLGVNFQAGNTKQATYNASAELARRTPATQFLVNYLGNYSEVNGSENANNHRVNLSYDVRLNKAWFARPVQLEYYRDQLANIAHRVTAGVGFGAYIFDRDDLEWKLSAGPGYQYTRFETVAPGESDTASTPAGIFQTRFKADITSKLTFIQVFAATLASKEAGLYSHHLVSTLEFEIKRHLDLDISFVWDYLQNPQQEASGVVPLHSDFRLTVGVGVKF